MYNSQYYTCEQIDERLLQGYVDDYNTQTGQSLTKEQFLTKLDNIFAKETVINNTAVNIGYFVCDTAAGTAAKTLTAAGYELFQGGSIKVKFTNRNTAGSATLNINSKGAKALYYGGKAVSASNSWDNGEVVEIYYDGTSYYANNVEGNFKDGIFDISAYNLTEGQPTKYDTLAEALGTNGNNVPPIFRKGGMQIKYVSTSDNKYVQYRLMANAWSTIVSDWQGVDDEPTAGSDNLVKSGGVYPLEIGLSALNEKSSINLVLGEQKSGYYNGSITPVANNGIYYDGVDVSNYSVVLVTFDNAADASGRQIITAKKDGTIVATYKEMDYIEADGVYRNIIPLTEDVSFIYISCNSSATNITATGYVREYSNAEGKETEKSLNAIRSNTRNLFNADLMPVLNSWTGITSFVRKGEYYFSGQATETASKYSEKIILPQGSYVFSVGTEKQIHGYIRLFDSEDNVLETIMLNNTVKSAIVTISASVAYAYWSIGGISGVNYGDGTNLKLMIESGTELSAYIPHDTAIDTVVREKVAVIEDEIKELKGVDELVFGTQKSGYYNGSVTPVENNGIYYDPVNIENYFKLDITFDNAASASGRMILVTDANDNILASYKEMDYIQGSKYINTINLPGSAAKLYVSYNTSATNLKVIGYERMEKTICYVATTGSDSNDGLTRATPFLTIQKALNEGYKTILVKEGVYTDMISMEGLSGVKIMLDRMYDTYTALTDEDNPKFVIDGTTNSLQKGLYIYDCQNCVISDIEIRNCTIKGIEVVRSEGLRFDDCSVHDIGVENPTGSVGGYALTNVSADFYNCVAYNIGTTQKGQGSFACDGFNIHGTGVTNFINCSAWNCEDDGISHHDACYGLVDGGEWYNCGKGGICTPTHGAKVNIQNVYSHDNLYGIYAFKPDGYAAREKLIFSNCVCKSNSADIEINRYEAILINCVYDRLVGQEFVTIFNS